MRIGRWFVIVTVVLLAVPALGQSDPSAAIKAVLEKQVADWNKGDVDAFAKGYKVSPDILVMGDPISRGYAGMVANYKKRYGTKEKMGVLSFSELAVQPLDARFATTTGKFHLERTDAGGGNADGYFLLVFEKTVEGWKCIRDSSTPMVAGDHDGKASNESTSHPSDYYTNPETGQLHRFQTQCSGGDKAACNAAYYLLHPDTRPPQ